MGIPIFFRTYYYVMHMHYSSPAVDSSRTRHYFSGFRYGLGLCRLNYITALWLCK